MTKSAFATAALLAPLLFQFSSSTTPTPARHDTGWGVSMRTDRVYYSGGEDLRLSATIFNDSSDPAYGLSGSSSGVGCTFWVTIRDEQDNVVWQPGSVVNGQYFGPGCNFGMSIWDLTQGSSIDRIARIPLVYQNPDGNGVLGDPLAPGYYSVCFRMSFNGPTRTPPIAGRKGRSAARLDGGRAEASSVSPYNQSAAVPILIES